MSSEDQEKPRSHLIDLAVKYFKKEGYKVNYENAQLEGHSGILRRFDLIVQKGRFEQGVRIRDWNRTIGVNVIINLDSASEDVDLSSPIMIGDKFSDHAKSYSNRRKITLLTKQKLGSLR
jgi:Restriction endonuclease